jgi:hypothetical protein
MARLDLQGIEHELLQFLEGEDLATRASASKTRKLVDIINGDAKQAILQQHGIQINEDGSIVIAIKESILSQLRRASQDASGLKLNADGSVTSTVSVCFCLQK